MCVCISKLLTDWGAWGAQGFWDEHTRSFLLRPSSLCGNIIVQVYQERSLCLTDTLKNVPAVLSAIIGVLSPHCTKRGAHRSDVSVQTVSIAACLQLKRVCPFPLRLQIESMDVLQYRGGGKKAELIANHIKLQLSPPPPHCSIGYIRCVLQGPGNNRGQECQIMLFHMAVNV